MQNPVNELTFYCRAGMAVDALIYLRSVYSFDLLEEFFLNMCRLSVRERTKIIKIRNICDKKNMTMDQRRRGKSLWKMLFNKESLGVSIISRFVSSSFFSLPLLPSLEILKIFLGKKSSSDDRN